jgi:hypothetical protein
LYGAGRDLSGVILNVTVTNPTAPGFLTLYPDDASLPTASDVNFTTGETVPNLALVKLGASDLGFNTTNFFGGGFVDVVIDQDGIFTQPVLPLTFSALTAGQAPTRHVAEPETGLTQAPSVRAG